jgi:hypothetical protein
MNFLSDGARELGNPFHRQARLKPASHRGYPAVYHRRWFPVLDRHPDLTVDTLDGYVWVETPWKIQSLWAADLEIVEELPEQRVGLDENLRS